MVYFSNDQLGYRTNDYMVTATLQVLYIVRIQTARQYTQQKFGMLQTRTQTVAIKDKFGKQIGKANIGAKAFVSFNIDTEKQFELTQTATPTVKAKALATEKLQKM